jgi:hypothetical protein
LPEKDEDAALERSVIKGRGYIPHPMKWNTATGRYYVEGTINGVRASFDVSTVSNNVVDLAFARSAGIGLGPVVGQAGGPKGSLTDQYITKRQVSIAINGQTTAPTQPLVWNIAAYDTKAQSDEQVTLGAEFMLANGAIIDFGGEVLYLPVARR